MKMSLNRISMGQKRPHKSISIQEKIALIEKLEKGVSVASICKEYGIAKQTVSDIRKKKDELLKFVTMFSVDNEKTDMKRMRMPAQQTLDEIVYKWYIKLRSDGVAVRGAEIQTAADTLAKQLGIVGFSASSGWLFRFRKRHNISQKRIQGDRFNTYTESTDVEDIQAFREALSNMIKEQSIQLGQLYNVGVTHLLWKALPENIQAFNLVKHSSEYKMCREEVLTLLCSNADGRHVLKPVIVGKSELIQTDSNNSLDLPVHYYFSRNSCLTAKIIQDWFRNHALPEIIEYQVEHFNISREDVKSVILLENIPATHSSQILCSPDGRIKSLIIPSKISSFVLPMNQGIIYVAKRLYKKRFLADILNVTQTDGKPQSILQNLKLYNLRSMVSNFAASTREIDISTLVNCWKNLLSDIDEEPNFSGLETEDFYQILHGMDIMVTMEEVELWLEADEDDSGHQSLKEKEVSDFVDVIIKSDDDEGAIGVDHVQERDDDSSKMKISDVKEHLDYVLNYVRESKDLEILACYKYLRNFEDLLNKKINVNFSEPGPSYK